MAYNSTFEEVKHFLDMHADTIGGYLQVMLACILIYGYGRATGKLDGIREANRR